MTLPTFLIIGAHKAATSSLYRYLKEHPDVYMPTLKEARFFSYNPESTVRQGVWEKKVHPIKTLQEYEALFDKVAGEKAIGEASPDYLNSRFAAEGIKTALPNVQLIASLRNPADRLYSMYQMAVRAKQVNEPFESLFRQDGYWNAKSIGYYQRLKHYYDRFDRENIKVVLFENINADALSVVADLYRFLEVDDSFAPDVSVRYNPGGMAKNRAIYNLFSNRTARNVFRSVVPERFHAFFANIRDNNLQALPPLNEEIRQELLQEFEEDTLRVQELVGLDLSVWMPARSVSWGDSANQSDRMVV